MRTKEEEEEEGAGVSVVRVEACTMLRSGAASRNKRITTRHNVMLAVISSCARARVYLCERVEERRGMVPVTCKRPA